MHLNTNSSTSKIEKNNEVIIIYLASGGNPFGENKLSEKSNDFVINVRNALIRNRVNHQFHCINSQNIILRNKDTNKFSEFEAGSVPEYDDATVMKMNPNFKWIKTPNDLEPFANKLENCFYNGTNAAYNPKDKEELNSLNPKYNYNFLENGSMEFYSKWIDNIIAKNPNSKILIIDGFGGNAQYATNLTIKKAKEFEGNQNVCFVSSCSCCCTGIVGKDFLSQFRDIENLPLTSHSRCVYFKLEKCSSEAYQIANFSDMIIKDVLQINEQNLDTRSVSDVEDEGGSRINLPALNLEKPANLPANFETLPKLAEKELERFN